MQPSSERLDADPTGGELFADRLVGEDHGAEQDSRLRGANTRGQPCHSYGRVVPVASDALDHPRGGGHDGLVGPDAALHRGGRSRRTRDAPGPATASTARPSCSACGRSASFSSTFGIELSDVGFALRLREDGAAPRAASRRGSAPRPCGPQRSRRRSGLRFEQEKHTQLLAAAAGESKEIA